MEFVDRRGQVGDLRGVDLRGPALSGGELQIGRDRVVHGVEEVLQIPPSHSDRAHPHSRRRRWKISCRDLHHTGAHRKWRVILVVLVLMLLFAAPAQAAGSGGAEAAPFTVAPANVAAGQPVTISLRAHAGHARPRGLHRARQGRGARQARPRRPQRRAQGDLDRRARRRSVHRPARAHQGRVRPGTCESGLNVTTPAAFSTRDRLGDLPRPGPVHLRRGRSRASASGARATSTRGRTSPPTRARPSWRPSPASVFWIAYQADGAGYYVVIAGADGRHYVFMHLQANSTARHQGPGDRRRSADRFGGQHRRVRPGRTCTSRSGSTAGGPRRPRSRSTRCPTCRRGPRASTPSTLTQPALSSGSLRLPHFGDCTQDGQPDSHGHSLTSR